MRKALIAFCLLFALAVGGMTAIHAEVNEVRDQVVITEEIIYGDKAAAEGLTILAQAALENGHLNWNTTYTIGEQPKTHTEFKYSSERRDRNVYHEPMGLMLGNSLHDHSSNWNRASDSSELSGIDLAYWELREETPFGEEGKRQIRIADYYDYYPMRISLEVPNYNLEKTFGEISMAISPEQFDNMERVYDALENYLKIPVLPGETMNIDLYHTEAGVHSWGSSTGGSVRYDTWARTTVTDNACYFVVNNRATDDRIMDFSHIPGGYGIHMISYRDVDSGAGTIADPDSLRMVYPLDEESRVLWMEHTEENDRLLLTTLEGNGDTVLRVIECGSMKTLQEIVLYEGVDVNGFYAAICEEDFVAICSAGNRIILLEERSDGTYDMAIDITVNDDQTVGYGFHTTHWDGEKLVLACPWAQVDWQSGDNCGFGIAVYDKTGALFVAKYTSSLDTKTYSPYDGNNCFLWSENPLRISWE